MQNSCILLLENYHQYHSEFLSRNQLFLREKLLFRLNSFPEEKLIIWNQSNSIYCKKYFSMKETFDQNRIIAENSKSISSEVNKDLS